MRRVVCAIIRNPAGKFLIAQRPEGKFAAGLWEFAGGKIDAGETHGAALVRELKEELNLDLTGEIFYHFYRKKIEDLCLDYYFCQPKRFLVAQAMENQQFAWIDLNEFLQFKFIPSNQDTISLLLKKFS